MPGVHGQANGRLAVNMGDWNISDGATMACRCLLPLRLRAPERDRVEGGAGAAGGGRARGARGAAAALDRRCADPLRVSAAKSVARSPRSATSGSTPASSVLDAGLAEPRECHQGYGPEPPNGLTKADLPDHAYWEEWFPADWVSEMREQIRLWFYSQLFMFVVLTGRALQEGARLEQMLDETGRETHTSWGNTIDAPDAFARMGADVMRWQFCDAAPRPEPALRLRPGARDPAEAADALEFGAFLADYATIGGFRPDYGVAPPVETAPLDRWLAARTDQLVARRPPVRRVPDRERDPGVRGVRRGRLQLVHPPLAATLLDGDASALQALWHALVQGIRVVAPVMPFLAEHLWQSLVRGADGDPPPSVHLAGWPEAGAADQALLDEVGELRRVVGLGHQAGPRAAEAPPAARRLVVEGAPLAEGHAEELPKSCGSRRSSSAMSRRRSCT